MLLVQTRLHRQLQDELDRGARDRAERLRAEAERQHPPTPAEIAGVEHKAKALVRRKLGVDPDAHGRRGLVLAEARKLLGK